MLCTMSTVTNLSFFEIFVLEILVYICAYSLEYSFGCVSYIILLHTNLKVQVLLRLYSIIAVKI